MAALAGETPRLFARRLGRHLQGGHSPPVGPLRGDRRGSALLRLDRQHPSIDRRRAIEAARDAAQAEEPLVQDQQGAGRAAGGGRHDDAGRFGRDRGLEIERQLGGPRCGRAPRRARGPPGGARCAPESARGLGRLSSLDEASDPPSGSRPRRRRRRARSASPRRCRRPPSGVVPTRGVSLEAPGPRTPLAEWRRSAPVVSPTAAAVRL
jgi:hypothetical protein